MLGYIKELFAEINHRRFKAYLVGFTHNISRSLIHAAKWPYLLLHFLAIGLTFPMVIYNIDWEWYLLFRQCNWLQVIFWPAVTFGGLVPLLIPPFIYLYAKKEDHPQLEPLAFAMTQAAVLGLFWSSFYKAFTGRKGPEPFDMGAMMEQGNYSNDFAIGFLRRGVFDGWPSGHTTIAWAIAIVFYFYFSKDSYIKNEDIIDQFQKYRKYAILFAIYVGFGVSTNIHWLSDAVAGMLVGIAVGISVSRNFVGSRINLDDIYELSEKREISQIPNVKWVGAGLLFTIIFSIVP